MGNINEKEAADKVRPTAEALLEQVKADVGKAFAVKKLTGTIVVSSKKLAGTIDSFAEDAFGKVQEIRQDFNSWFTFAKDIDEWAGMIADAVEFFEIPISIFSCGRGRMDLNPSMCLYRVGVELQCAGRIMLMLGCALMGVFIVRCVLEMILDIVDMCAYCHEEHLKEDPEIVIARVKND